MLNVRIRFLALLLGLIAGIPASLGSQDIVAPETVRAGPLLLRVYVTRTAQVFHVVDQLSGWTEFSHAQYRRHFADLDEDDERVLSLHAQLRREKPWGHGLEDALYTDVPMEQALSDAVGARTLTTAEAEIERQVLSHFTRRVDALITELEDELARSTSVLDKAELTRAADSLGRLTGVEQLLLPVFLVASPGRVGGGRLAGGRLIVEVPEGGASLTTWLHEVAHAFLHRAEPLLSGTVAQTPGLDLTTLGEGIAYALVPGLYPATESDGLSAILKRFEPSTSTANAGNAGRLPAYLSLAAALRPDLARAVAQGTTLEELLPQARLRWQELHR